MSIRQSAALNLAPLTLRVALGLIFIYYGLGKFYSDMVLTPEQEVRLVELGILESRVPSAGADPSAFPMITPASFQETRPQESIAEGVQEAVDGAAEAIQETIEDAAQGAEEAVESAQEAVESATTQPETISEAEEAAQVAAVAALEPRTVRRMTGLMLMMDKNAQGPSPNWPGFLASGQMLEVMAWAAAITELAGGFFVLVGFLARFWALGLAGTMATAMWLTMIAPSVGTADAFLGFLPTMQLDNPQTWTSAYQLLFLQFALFASAVGLFLAGPGALSLDHLLPWGSKPKKKKTSAPDTPQAHA